MNEFSVEQLYMISAQTEDDIKDIGYKLRDKERSLKEAIEKRDKAAQELKARQQTVDEAQRALTAMRNRQNTLSQLRVEVQKLIPPTDWGERDGEDEDGD